MSIKQFIEKSFINVALRVDDALDMTSDEYQSYLDSGCDASLLKLKDSMTPTYFKLRRSLPYGLSLKLENMKTEMVRGSDGVVQPSVKMAFIIEEVRYSIVDVISEDIDFKRDSEGLCDESIMEIVLSTGCHMDLWTAKQTNVKVDKKK
jgi:hypothetical protein